MFHVIYVSSAVKLFSRPELHELLAVCVRNNTRIEVTGMLLHKEGNFMQVLEGEEATVRRLQKTIESDRRHRVRELLSGTLPERNFSSWAMGFRDLTAAGSDAAPGFSQFLNTPLTAGEFSRDRSRAHQLLLTFKKAI
jgi:hypothetical protein